MQILLDPGPELQRGANLSYAGEGQCTLQRRLSTDGCATVRRVDVDDGVAGPVDECASGFLSDVVANARLHAHWPRAGPRTARQSAAGL